METVVQNPEDVELNLLTNWDDPYFGPRPKKAAIFSVLVHLALILLLVLLPPETGKRPPRAEVHRVITPLIDPPTELTQKAPNTGKISKEFSAAESEARPRIQAPPALASTSRAKPQRAAAMPAVPAPKPAPAVPLPEPPKVEAAAAPKSDLPAVPAPLAPPQIQAEEKPKLAFENPAPPPPPVTPGQGRIPVPTGSPVQEAVRQAARGNVSGAGMIISDGDSPGQAGFGAGINQPSSNGAAPNTLQLLSDPQGVDFRPYLIRVLATVKQHWLAVIPESVRLGRRGKTAIQFSISRDGAVPKLVIASPSGADALDRAAVAGVSASVPFPPLPSEFKGDKIVLQFNFAYNTK
ncbi:MAG TPA: TonB family protein [Bryobacteraceae bacterium]|nr:TonB family protein [Bryobacteraceae bacterium]